MRRALAARSAITPYGQNDNAAHTSWCQKKCTRRHVTIFLAISYLRDVADDTATPPLMKISLIYSTIFE